MGSVDGKIQETYARKTRQRAQSEFNDTRRRATAPTAP